MYDKLPGNMLLAASMIIAGFGSILVTVVKSVFLLGFVVSFQGAAMGGLDCGANVMLIYAWRDQVGPWMQAMHASFAVGAFFAPMLIRAVQGEVADPASGSGAGAGAGVTVGSGAYKPAFMVMGAVCMLCGLLITLMKSPRPRTQGQAGSAGSASVPAGQAAQAGVPGAALAPLPLVGSGAGVPLPVGSVGGPLGSPASHGSLSIALFSSPSQQQLSLAALDSGIAIDGAAAVPVSPAGASAAAGAAVAPKAAVYSGFEDAAWGVGVGMEGAGMQMATPAKSSSSSSSRSIGDGQVDAVVCAPAGEVAIVHYAHQQASGEGSGSGSGSGAHVPELPVSELPQNLKNDRLSAVLIVAVLLGLYVGAETSYGAFLTSYAVIALRQSESLGQVLTGVYWGGLTVGRILAIPASVRIPPAKLLGGSMAGCVAACVVLLFGQSSVGVMWVFSAIFGFFMACIFPTAVALAESYFPVTGSDATIFVIGSATGEMILPFVISSLFGDESGHTGDGGATPSGAAQRAAEDSYSVGPSIMLWVVAIGCTLNMAVYWLLVKRGKALHADLAAAAAAASGDAAIANAAAAATSSGGSEDPANADAARKPLSAAGGSVDVRPLT